MNKLTTCELRKALEHRLSQCPPTLGYIFVPKEWVQQTVDELEVNSEVCICAAVQTKEGLVIRGHRHHDCRDSAMDAYCTPIMTEEGQGFITSRNRFVSREEGYELQIAARIGSYSPGGYRGKRLFSEDLY